jgi:ribosomal protein S6
MPEGYYVVVTFKSEPAFPAEFERLANIDETVLRSMVIKLEYDAVERKAKKDAEAAEKAAAAEAVVAEEAETVEPAEATEE